MTFVVTQDLVLGVRPAGDDDRDRGALPEVVWDVTIRNPGGQTGQALGALAVVAAPAIEALSPEIVCLEQGARTIVLSGRGFLRNEAQRAQLDVDGVDQ